MQTSVSIATSELQTAIESGASARRPRRYPKVGAVLGQYRLEGHLGRGGMGDVFVARGLSDEVVALKYIDFDTPTLLYRFKREFRALAEVHHPNLVSLGELHVLGDGRAYYTMEIVEGVSFVDYIRQPDDQPERLARLLRVTIQLVEGVCHLHEAGCIHRDIKPSNVLVTPSGRVVLLDFGVVSEFSNPGVGISHTGQLLGTPAYMAPEQAQLNRCRPVSDFYSIGVMIYEALYGRRPLHGSSCELLALKCSGTYQLELPDSPEVPDRLRELCARLLATESWKRPHGQEFLHSLRSLQSNEKFEIEPIPPSVSSDIGLARPFVGRVREAAALLDAYETSQARGQAVCVCLSGASGLGKSTLLDRFVDKLVATQARSVILRGRCLERESVPYRGVDEIVDALSVFLRRIPLTQRLSLQPRHAGALAQLFPVLGELWPNETQERSEPSQRRDDGILALREVLTRIGDRRPLAILIDDFHWADADGRRVLAELVQGPNAPVMLLIVSYRDGLSSPVGIFGRGYGANKLDGLHLRELRLAQLSPRSCISSVVRSSTTSPWPHGSRRGSINSL